MRLLIALWALLPAAANATDRITPCMTEIVRSENGFKSFEVHLVADDRRGFHKITFYKNEGPNRTELPPVNIYFQPLGQVSNFVSTETRELVIAYRERAAPTREGIVVIQDGGEALQLSLTCYLL